MNPRLPTDPNAPQGALDAVDAGVTAADNADKTEEQARIEQAEKDVVKALWEEYEEARKFDKDARAQYAIDRRYAAGTANLNWTVSANLIGAFIDILVSFLYARNPDVSARKAPRIDNSGTQTEDDFAKTIELVVSSLWKAPTARLKQAARSQVRSILTTGIGWLKVILVCKGTNIPQMKAQLNDIRDNIARLEALRPEVTVDENGQQVVMTPDNDVLSIEQLNVKTAEFRELEASVQNRMEVAMRKALAIDFVSSEDIQVSLDVRNIEDYVNAKWVANRIYRPISGLKAMFPTLSDSDVKEAKQYFQRANKELSPLSENVQITGVADSNTNADDAEQYVTDTGRGSPGSDKSPAHGCIVELWNRETGHVHTMIEGIKRWAKQPYQPDYPTSRFFPYFGCAFYPVDGARHPQSLTWRLMKLQDEYASTRSSLRRTRKRAAPGILFNKSGLTPDDAKRIEGGTEQEFIGISPTQPDQPLNQLFAEKPIALGDMRLYDTTPITADMEKLSGVQDALQSSTSPEKTATEAEIQQTGFSARTTSDRDAFETMLTDLANYTSELAVSALEMKDAQRIAGAKAFWPHGMAIDDLLTMVEVQIEAGTTGKPKSSGDKNAWGVVMPMMQQTIQVIHQAQLAGDMPLANALTELIKETMHRMGDESDVSRFIPQMPPVPPPVPGMGLPGALPPGAGGAPLPPPVSPGAPAGPEPTSLADTLAPPELNAPDLIPPQ